MPKSEAKIVWIQMFCVEIHHKAITLGKKPRQDFWHPIVVYFDQLSGAAHTAAHTQKLVKTLFSVVFNLLSSFLTFSSDFTPEIKK